MAEVTVQQDFWHTSVGISVRRVIVQAGVLVVILAAQVLMAKDINWSEVLYSLRFQVGYLVFSTYSTFRDPKIPTTTNDTVQLQKG